MGRKCKKTGEDHAYITATHGEVCKECGEPREIEGAVPSPFGVSGGFKTLNSDSTYSDGHRDVLRKELLEKKIPDYVFDAIRDFTRSQSVIILTFEDILMGELKGRFPGYFLNSVNVPVENVLTVLKTVIASMERDQTEAYEFRHEKGEGESA